MPAPVVLSVSGCTGVGDVTINCTLPVTLRLLLGNITQGWSIQVSVHGEICPLIDGPTDEGETTCQLPFVHSASLPRDVLLNVTVGTWNRVQVTGPPFAGQPCAEYKD